MSPSFLVKILCYTCRPKAFIITLALSAQIYADVASVKARDILV